MEILQWLEAIDKDLFLFINREAAVPQLDGFFKMLRNANTWILLYAGLLYWIIVKARPYAIPFILLTLVTFALTDHISAAVLKPWFGRIRPCYNEEFDGLIRNLVGCGGQYSMPSTHATNHFGLATFWFLSISYMRGNKWYWLWIWAFAIGYAQVYVGKHYPFDIVAGAILGIFIAVLMYFLFRAWLRKAAAPKRLKTDHDR